MEFVPTPRFLWSYHKLPLIIREQTDRCLELLGENPRHPSLRTHKRAGESNLWQARVTRDFRLFFELCGDTITLIDIGPHEK